MSAIYKMDRNVENPEVNTTGIYTFTRGNKFFELSNHLGNVLVTVSDRKLQVQEYESSTSIEYYAADITTAGDGYSGGMEMPSRTFAQVSATYRYSINGQEKSPEIGANTTTAEFWQYDARIVRRWNVDPLIKDKESPYLVFSGNPLWFRDIKGADTIIYNTSGIEINRFYSNNDTRHVFLLDGKKDELKSGLFDFHGKKYIRGFSYFSLFGDPDGNEKPTLFKSISQEIKSLTGFLDQEEEVKKSFSNSRLPQFSKRFAFWFNSGYEGLYDYKNDGILGQNGESTVYEIEGMLYNRRELGMMKWGYIASGVYNNYQQLMLHNNRMHESVEGNGDEWNEMYSWTFGYLYGKNKSSSIVIHKAADNLLKTYNSMYWYLRSPYRADKDYKEEKDSNSIKTKIKRLWILTL
ncbi:MAG: hypothetical protein NTW29_09070 [Bacteroidetes bacterium]|nr:hypothetical protein [Bacteroidota bacterium]